MSVSSILAFVLAGVAAKAKSVQVARPSEDRIAELEAERERHYDKISIENVALRTDNADLRRRVSELEDDIARANVQYRRDQDLIDIWRERALVNVPALQAPPIHAPPPGFGLDLQRAAAAMQQQAQLAQHANHQSQGLQGLAQYQQAMNAQNYAQAQAFAGMGLLGAQNLIDAELWCNCVPSRSQVWATSDPE